MSSFSSATLVMAGHIANTHPCDLKETMLALSDKGTMQVLDIIQHPDSRWMLADTPIGPSAYAPFLTASLPVMPRGREAGSQARYVQCDCEHGYPHGPVVGD